MLGRVLRPDRDLANLSALERARYALVAFGCGVPHFLLLMYFLRYATGALGIDSAVIGAIFGASRIWDAVSDPAVGALSDRLRTRFGRRRPWLIGGGVALALAALAVWVPPSVESPSARIAWVGGAVFLYFSAHTLVFVPYDALGIELTRGYDARNRLYTYRFFAYHAAMFGGVGAVSLFTSADSPGSVGAWVGVGAAACVLLGVLPLALSLEERAHVSSERPARAARLSSGLLFSGLRRVAADRDTRTFMTIEFIGSAGAAALSALGPFLVAILLGDEAWLPIVMGAYIGSSLVTAPFVTRMARRFGVWRMWSLSLAAGALAFAGFWFVQPGRLALMLLLVGVGGASTAFQTVLTSTLLAALVDRSRDRGQVADADGDEGAYSAVRTFLHKSAYGVAVMLAGVGLSALGYSNDDGTQLAADPSTARNLRLLIVLPPAASLAVAFGLSFRVRVDRD